MEPITKLDIQCQGATEVLLDELHELQGNLKDLTDESYAKLRDSMIRFGFSFPIFMWEDKEGTKWIVDAHQRKRTLIRMRSEGIEIPPLPADYIHAKDKQEAKKKLLLQESKYGVIREEGLYEFMNEAGFEIQPDDIGDLLSIPEFDQEYNPKTDAEQEKQQFPPKEIECPACHHHFIIDKAEQ